MVKKPEFAQCHPDRKVLAKGLCRSCYEKNLKKNNPEFAERQRTNARNWAEKNKDRLEKYRKQRNTDPQCKERDKQTHKRNYLSRKYGMSNECVEKLKQAQQNKCPICERLLTDVKKIHIDHNHTTGYVRGILCSKCNNGLGFFNDDIQLFTKVLSYLQSSTEFKTNRS